MQSRRKFIKVSCTACVVFAGLGILLELDSCKTADPNSITITKSQVIVPLSQIADNNILLIKSASLDYDIALVKKSKNDFVAIKMVCTHRLNPVTITEKGFFCPSHGSEFDLDGNVKKGPAPTPLMKFSTMVQKGKAIIAL